MTRVAVIGTLTIVSLILGIVGCRMFDDAPTAAETTTENLNPSADFIMDAPEIDGWGAHYEPGNSFVRVDIPVSGALKVEYSTTSGWSGAIFAHTVSPVGLEIGLVTRDGVTDVVEEICVSSVEDGSFTSMPANLEISAKEDWTHYKRITDDGAVSDWWPTAAAFTFSNDASSVCGIVNSEVQWELIPGGAFEKPCDPSKLLVDTENDVPVAPPACPLRTILAAGPPTTGSNHTISFAPGVTTVMLNGAQLRISSKWTGLTIDGGSGVILDGDGRSRVLTIASGADVSLKGLTIQHGDANKGGGIYNEGDLTLEADSTVSGNHASEGGGIYNKSGTLTLHGTVNNNTSGGGGGIFNHEGSLTIDGTVSDNTSEHNSGGGIRNESGTLTLTLHGTIGDNTAPNGGGISNSDGNLTIYGTVSGNMAAGWNGGGIESYGPGVLTLYGTVSGNTAKQYGGGIIYGDGGTLTHDGTVSGNTADENGGGIFIVRTSTLTLKSRALIEGNHCNNNNSGAETGGGLYLRNSSLSCSGIDAAIYGSGNYRGSGTGTVDNCYD